MGRYVCRFKEGSVFGGVLGGTDIFYFIVVFVLKIGIGVRKFYWVVIKIWKFKI